MKDLLIDVLESICPNVYLQGSLNPDERYPDDFITFFIENTRDLSHYDNEVNAINWEVTVIYYSTNPVKVNTVPAQIRTALKDAKFIISGRGADMPCDRESHTGWVMNFTYTEKIINN